MHVSLAWMTVQLLKRPLYPRQLLQLRHHYRLSVLYHRRHLKLHPRASPWMLHVHRHRCRHQGTWQPHKKRSTTHTATKKQAVRLRLFLARCQWLFLQCLHATPSLRTTRAQTTCTRHRLPGSPWIVRRHHLRASRNSMTVCLQCRPRSKLHHQRARRQGSHWTSKEHLPLDVAPWMRTDQVASMAR